MTASFRPGRLVHPRDIVTGQQLFLSEEGTGGVWVDVLAVNVERDRVLVDFLTKDGQQRRAVALPRANVQYRVREPQQPVVVTYSSNEPADITRLKSELLDWIDGKRSSSDLRLPPVEAPYLGPLVAIADAVRAVALSAAIMALSVPSGTQSAPAPVSGPSADN